jgi:hypothetical protein
MLRNLMKNANVIRNRPLHNCPYCYLIVKGSCNVDIYSCNRLLFYLIAQLEIDLMPRDTAFTFTQINFWIK